MPFASASRSVDVIRFLIKKNPQLGVELETNRFCIEKESYWPTSDRIRNRNCGCCESFDGSTLHGDMRMPYGYLIEVFGEFLFEILGCTATKL
jgi:hypothetical protein